MTTIITVILILSIAVPFGAYYLGVRKSPKALLFTNISAFFGTLIFASVSLFSGTAFAEPTAAAAADSSVTVMGFLAAAIVTGLATIGAGIAVASSASAALGALSENDKIMGKALIFVALAEGIALYGLLVSFSILGRI